MQPTDLCTAPVLLVRNAIIPSLDVEKKHDMLIRDGAIAACSPSGSLDAPTDAERIDASGKRLFPSFVDAHTHLREPGHEYKEDIASGLAAAAHGGFGAVMPMANTRPINDNASITRYMLEKAAANWPHGPRLLPVGALTMGLKGTELAPLGELGHAGCIAFSNDGLPVANAEIFRRGMEYASMWNKIIIDHCEDTCLTQNAPMNEGEVSGKIGVKGQPTVSEALHVARDILWAEYLKLPVHLAHISCRQSLNLIKYAKDQGVRVTAETCPHYLILDDSCLETYNAAYKVNPPLRGKQDVEAVRKALKDGVIDMLTTDHAPHAEHEKEHPLDDSPYGFIGLETALPLTYEFVRTGLITEKDFVRLWHDAPAAIFNIRVNNFQPGDPADFFFFDPELEWQANRDTLHSKSLNTPFLGMTLRGKVTAHWLGGWRIV